MQEVFTADAPGVVDLVEALHERVASLEAALQTASDNLALREEVDVIVAREICTPLTVVLGALETITSGLADEADCAELVRASLRHSQVARATIDDLVRPGVQPGQLVPRAALETVDLRDVINDVIDRFVPDDAQAAASGFDLRVTSAPARLRAILGNFVDNAIRFAPDRTIDCEARLVNQTLRLSVSDRGPGPGPTNPEDLFQPDTAGSSRRLGLYIARMVAPSLGGDAFIAARKGGGTTAWVTLPQRRPGDTTNPT